MIGYTPEPAPKGLGVGLDIAPHFSSHQSLESIAKPETHGFVTFKLSQNWESICTRMQLDLLVRPASRQTHIGLT
jgi:hypothetical protein